MISMAKEHLIGVWALLIKSEVCVIGIARECGKQITEGILRIVGPVLKVSNTVDFFVVENDSTDYI